MLPTVRHAVLAASSGYYGPLDNVPGGTSFIGLRAGSRSYARNGGASMDIVKTSDGSSAKTIYFRRDGSLDVKTIAALGYGVSVTKVYDHTGNGHHHTQATLANMPTITLAGLGLLPIMNFNGTTMYLEETAAIALGNQPLSIAAVVNSSNGTAGRIWRNAAVISLSNNFAGANQLTIQTTGGLLAAMTNAAYHAIAIALNSSSTALRVDDTETGGADGSNPGSTNPGTNVQIIGSNKSTAWFTGQIQELGLWAGVAFSTVSRANLNSNAKAYWKF